MKAKQQAGQGAVEYAFLLLLVVVGTLLILQLMGISVRDVYCRVASGFSANACSLALCQDDFDNLNGSKGLTGSWKPSNGKICIEGGGTFLNKCSMNMTDNDYTATLDGADLGAGNGYGIFFRATDTGSGINGYAFQYDPGLNGFVIRKWVNGREINPAIAFKSVPGFDWYGKPHSLSVKVSGNTFTGYVDGKIMLVGQDDTYASGGAGVRTWDSTKLCIDKFSIDPTTH